MRRILLGLSLAVLVASAPAKAARIIYYVDMTHGPDVIGAALAGSGHTVTQATSWTELTNALLGGEYEVAIGLAQNQAAATHGLDAGAVADFIQQGGGFIFATWTPVDTPIVTAMGFALTGATNLSTVTITSPDLLVGGLPNPITVSNVGWGVFSTGLDGISLATFENGDDAIVSSQAGRVIGLGFLEDTIPVATATLLWQNMIARVAAVAVSPATIPAQTPVGLGLLAALLASAGVLAVRRLG